MCNPISWLKNAMGYTDKKDDDDKVEWN